MTTIYARPQDIQRAIAEGDATIMVSSSKAFSDWVALTTVPQPTTTTASRFGAHADRIGHWNEGPETFVIVKAKDIQLGVQTYGPPQVEQAGDRSAEEFAEQPDGIVNISAGQQVMEEWFDELGIDMEVEEYSSLFKKLTAALINKEPKS
jgi:hypothetical protein